MPRRIGSRALVVLFLVGTVAAVLASCSGPPPIVERVTINNNTGYDLDVQLSGPDGEGWLPAGIVEAGSERTSEQVVDQGEVWTFRFLHWGDNVGELSISRSELESNGWQVAVPLEVEERLRELERPTTAEIEDPEGGDVVA